MIKAYSLSIADDPDQGQQIVFAETASEAKKKLDGEQFVYDRWIDIQAHRSRAFDGMENLTKAELALEQWREGWIWFDRDTPDCDESTDEQFIAWYKDNFAND